MLFSYFPLFTRSLSAVPALKRTFFEAAILISLPVLGFLPVLAALSPTLKDPKPIKVTSSPFTIALETSQNQRNDV